MIEALASQPLLLLFLVIAVGYPLGQLPLGGVRLGVAAVLFAGLGVGAVDPRLALPEIVHTLGLVLFVYTVGLGSGPALVRMWRGPGLRYNLLAAIVLAWATLLTVATHMLLGLRPGQTAGLFAGCLTNTPALAAVLELVGRSGSATADAVAVSDPVVAYSITYPLGVVGVLLAIGLARRLGWLAPIRAGSDVASDDGDPEPLECRTVRVTCPDWCGKPLEDLDRTAAEGVLFGRWKHGDQLSLVTGDTCLAPGDLVTLVGPARRIEQAARAMGELVETRLDWDREQLDFRRMFVSHPQAVGVPLRELDLPGRLGAVVTRVRRGDVDFLPDGRTLLEPGDRVRVLTRRDALDRVARFFGDSYRAVSELDVLSFSLGLALGLLAGQVPLPVPGVGVVRLGLAGGPLVVALCLGALGRSGRFVWTQAYGVNLTLRQFGLMLFLAGVGTRAGYPFLHTLLAGQGLGLFVAGGAITFLAAIATLALGRYWLRMPSPLLLGLLAGLQTQPALLGHAIEQTKSDRPNLGYAGVYPLAVVLKIVIAQALLTVLS